ncbi:MAG: 2-amino-4-hydroxy-6-hydroxymethyldihydropteridine diphosphokinase [Treponema sp.]|nr:2-amino-4-hydroxy-6-hydroxymethyldihydropteridine diphosphokinase [Treponema sp.]
MAEPGCDGRDPVLVVLGLGSNRGDSPAILAGAVEKLGALLKNMRAASIIETEPRYVTDQPRFLNSAVCGYWDRSPRQLLETLHRVEAAFGRDRSRECRWGERTLDIDILLFGDQIVSGPGDLEIPHPRLNERAFALEPLVELLPDAVDPRTGRLFRKILGALAGREQ